MVGSETMVRNSRKIVWPRGHFQRSLRALTRGGHVLDGKNSAPKTHRFAWFATSGTDRTNTSARDNRLRREESTARMDD